MIKHIALTALATVVVAVPAPAALADEPLYDCGFHAVHQEDATGQNYEGAAWGYVVHGGGGPASISCYVTVNGWEASRTRLPVYVDGVGFTTGRVTFAAGATDVVALCAEVATPHGSFIDCEPADLQVLPQVVAEVLTAAHGAACEVTKTIGSRGFNVLNVVVIDAEGDLHVQGNRVGDCPPV